MFALFLINSENYSSLLINSRSLWAMGGKACLCSNTGIIMGNGEVIASTSRVLSLFSAHTDVFSVFSVLMFFCVKAQTTQMCSESLCSLKSLSPLGYLGLPSGNLT